MDSILIAIAVIRWNRFYCNEQFSEEIEYQLC